MLIENKHIYVDKSDILYDLVKKNYAIMITGPRRSGKTLLLSTIKTIFTENKDWWIKHCPNLKIVKEHQDFFSEKPFPILRFKFNQCKDDEMFKDKVRTYLMAAIEYYKLELNDNLDLIVWDKIISLVIPRIVLLLKNKFGKNPVVLIDECDQAIINQLFPSNNITKEQQKANIERTLDTHKQFYGLLKELLDEELRSVIICGHSMITQASIFSCK